MLDKATQTWKVAERGYIALLRYPSCEETHAFRIAEIKGDEHVRLGVGRLISDHFSSYFISDEIYAKSVFDNPAIPNQTPFVSTASLSPALIDSKLHHILYGASKDLCANGLRLGFMYTRNKGILAAMSSNR